MEKRARSRIVRSVERAMIVVVACIITSCKPTPEEQAKEEALRREKIEKECLNNICSGDKLPQYDRVAEFLFKLNGQIFIAPKEYGGYGPSLAFLWPSKTPARGKAAAQAPEWPKVQEGRFYDVAIELFFRANPNPPSGVSQYDMLVQAEKEGRLVSKKTLRPGLEVWKVRMNDGRPDGLWYVPTEMKDPKGNPPILWCNDSNPVHDRCKAGFRWRAWISADMRFRATHGADWLEIYKETMRVLALVREG